jgi:hypothetical protein
MHLFITQFLDQLLCLAFRPSTAAYLQLHSKQQFGYIMFTFDLNTCDYYFLTDEMWAHAHT